MTKEGIMYCQDCMFKHSRDLEHHLEDAVRVTEGDQREFYNNAIDAIRQVRKGIMGFMVKSGASTCDHETGCGYSHSEHSETCEGCSGE